MNDLFHINTVQRAMWFGCLMLLVFLGVSSLTGLVAGDPGVSGANVIACTFGALIGAVAGYATNENHVLGLKARGKLDRDSDGSELPAVRRPSTIPRLIAYILLLTLMVQGGIAFLGWLERWPSGMGWASWAITLLVVTSVCLATYVVGRRNNYSIT